MVADEPRRLEEAVEWLRKRFRPEASEGLSTVFEIELAGPAGGRIRGRIAGGALDVGVGAAERPDLRLRAQDHDFFALLAGRENAEMLFMADRISIDGDLSLAVRIRTLFRARA